MNGERTSTLRIGRTILRLAGVALAVLNAAFAGAMFAKGHLTLGMLATSVPGLGFVGASSSRFRPKRDQARGLLAQSSAS